MHFKWMTAIAVVAAFVIGNQRSQAQVYNTTWSDEFNGPHGSPSTYNWFMETGNNNGWGNKAAGGFLRNVSRR